MPIYEYECRDCEKEVSIFFLSFADARNEEAVCPECGSGKLERIVSGVAVLKEKKPASRTSSSGGAAHKEDDPGSLARFPIPGGGGGLGIGTIIVLGLLGWALGIDPRILIGGAEIIGGLR